MYMFIIFVIWHATPKYKMLCDSADISLFYCLYYFSEIQKNNEHTYALFCVCFMVFSLWENVFGSMGVACHRWQKIYHKKSLLIPKPSWIGFCLVINCNSNMFITKITGSNVKMLPQRVMFLSSVTHDTMLASNYITL